MTTRRPTATKRFTLDAIEQIVMDAALAIIAENPGSDEAIERAHNVLVYGFETTELLRARTPQPAEPEEVTT